MMLIGIIPALQHLPLYTYVVTWPIRHSHD